MANRIVLNETSYHGKGAVQDIVTEVKKRCFKKALVVTDPDLIKFHVADNVTKLLDANGLAYEVYDKVKANPTVNVVKGGVEMFKSIGADYIIAIGGGSSIDTAKGIAIIVNNPEHADVKSLEGADVTKTSVCRLSRFPPLPALPRRSPSTMLLPTRKSAVNLSAPTVMIFPSLPLSIQT